MKRIVNIADVPLREHRHADKYAAQLGAIAPLLGASKLGYRITIVPPGKRAWPLHNHHANEEMFFILEGSGTLRMDRKTLPIRPGDVISAPAGGPETAHQIVNNGDSLLKYLCVSTMLEPDITEYPDSGKFAAFAGTAPGGSKQARRFEACARLEDRADYWEGED